MNLILCCTPLQVLIARKIIELHPNEQFFGVMFGGVWDKKRIGIMESEPIIPA